LGGARHVLSVWHSKGESFFSSFLEGLWRLGSPKWTQGKSEEAGLLGRDRRGAGWSWEMGDGRGEKENTKE